MDTEVGTAVLRRWEIIDSLRHEEKDKRTLVENLDCSRSTVNRAVRELESMGLIGYNDGKYTVTRLGETIASGFEETMETVELRMDLDPFLQWIPEDELDFDLHLLDDAELFVPEPGEPYRMINCHVDRLKTMDECYALIPTTGLHAAETAHDRIVNHGADCEIVVTPDVLDTYQNESTFTELLEEIEVKDSFNIFRTTTDFPFGLVIINDWVQILVNADEEPRALLETDDPTVRDWAETKFTEYKQQAEPVSISAEVAKTRS